MSSTSLNGKAALVTGGSRGIGRAITLALAAQGARVAFTYASNRTAADEVTASAGAGPGAAAPLEADLRSPEQASTLLARAREVLEQPVDVWCATRVCSLFGPFGQFTLEDFEQSFAVNARATFCC
jgi:3-oxoacyl-[acyl-carrier protein] reductase